MNIRIKKNFGLLFNDIQEQILFIKNYFRKGNFEKAIF